MSCELWVVRGSLVRRRRESDKPANERHLLCYVAATPASPSVSASECWQTPPSCRQDWGQTATEHLLWKSSSTTEASASVETSPRSRSSQATFRRTRRMIFPGERPGLDWAGGEELLVNHTAITSSAVRLHLPLHTFTIFSGL